MFGIYFPVQFLVGDVQIQVALRERFYLAHQALQTTQNQLGLIHSGAGGLHQVQNLVAGDGGMVKVESGVGTQQTSIILRGIGTTIHGMRITRLGKSFIYHD